MLVDYLCTYLDVEECVLVDSIGWPLSLQLEHQHTIVMTWTAATVTVQYS